MKKFLVRILYFLIPVLLMASVPIYILFDSYENFYEIDSVIERSDGYTIGYAYNDSNSQYLKWKKLQSHAPFEVIAIGSSRVLQFREQMFTKSFYNAGYTIITAPDFELFLKSLPKEKLPKYLIIGIDQWMFNEAWVREMPVPNVTRWPNAFSKYPNLTVLKSTWVDFISGKYMFTKSNGAVQKIGLNANVNGKGFRPDGSMNYGNQIDKILNDDPTYIDYKFRDTKYRIQKGVRRFQFANHINTNAISEIESLLKFCRHNNIKVVGFLPPFADAVYNSMLHSGNHDYVKQIYPSLKPVFEEYKSELYDFSTVSQCGSNDRETIDGFHGGELTYLKLMIKMLESGSALNETADLQKLKQDLRHPINRYSVYK